MVSICYDNKQEKNMKNNCVSQSAYHRHISGKLYFQELFLLKNNGALALSLKDPTEGV